MNSVEVSSGQELAVRATHRDIEGARPLVVYSLYSGKLYGTERMALATLGALQSQFDTLLLAPSGPIHDRAAHLGVQTRVLKGRGSLLTALLGPLLLRRPLVFFSTRVSDSLIFESMRRVLRGTHAHFHMVHGGSNDRDSYGRKCRLLRHAVQFVAVSKFVRSKLSAHGVPASRVKVVENFLPPAPSSKKLSVELRSTVRRVVIVSRLDPIKRLDLLFDALDANPALQSLSFRIYGTGSEAAKLAARAERHPNVELRGFDPRVRDQLNWADVYLHLCPEEPFGLAILEAIEAGLPVVVPDGGGASEIVRPGIDGLHFASDDFQALATTLNNFQDSSPAQREGWANSAAERLEARYGPQRGAVEYRAIIEETLS